jgi:hypothetical protein
MSLSAQLAEIITLTQRAQRPLIEPQCTTTHGGHVNAKFETAFFNIDTREFETCDHYDREDEWKRQAQEDAQARAVATVQHFASSKRTISQAVCEQANEALDAVEPGLALGQVSERTATNILGQYLTPDAVARILASK